MKHAVLVGGHDETFMYFRDMSIRVSVLQLGSSIGEHVRALTDEIHVVEDFKVDAVIDVVAAIQEKCPVDYIFSFTEDGLLPAALAGRHFGIPGMPMESCELCVDKRLMRAHLEGTEFAIASRVCNSPADVKEFFYANPGGIVVKAPKGAGSENVFMVSDESRLGEVLHAMPQEPFVFLVEELVGGHELSVETLTIDGHHQVLGVTDKVLYRDSLAERQQINVPDVIDPDLRKRVSEYCVRLLDRINYRHGPCHIELTVADDGFRVIEINNRVGGSYIGLLVELTTGISMFRETMRFLGDGGESVTEGWDGARYQFAATHNFYDPIDSEAVRTNLSGVDILRFHLAESKPRPERPRINDDKVGCVVFASNDRLRFDAAIDYLNTKCS